MLPTLWANAVATAQFKDFSISGKMKVNGTCVTASRTEEGFKQSRRKTIAHFYFLNDALLPVSLIYMK